MLWPLTSEARKSPRLGEPFSRSHGHAWPCAGGVVTAPTFLRVDTFTSATLVNADAALRTLDPSHVNVRTERDTALADG